MKKLLLLFPLFLLASCTTSPTPAQLNSAVAIANRVSTDYQAAAAAQSGTLTPTQAAAVLSNASSDLSTAAALLKSQAKNSSAPGPTGPNGLPLPDYHDALRAHYDEVQIYNLTK